MQPRDFDCLVVGGGPAGSVTGAYLARAGWRTLVVEKERFPRFHVGESLLPAGNAVLREIGAWEAVENAGFVRKFGAEFHAGDDLTRGKRVRFRDGLLPGLESTYQVERARFDELLLRHAAQLGCTVREETKVTALREVAGGYEAELRPSRPSAPAETTPPTTVRVGWVVDATGRDQLLTHPLKRDRVDPGDGGLPKRAAVFAHFRGVARAPGEEGGNIVIVRHADGWFWLIPIDAERTSVGLVTALDRVRAVRGRVAELFDQVVAGSAKLTELLRGAEPVTNFHVTGDYTYRARRFAGPRLVMVGDAAAFYDPIFSSGVFLALHSAKLAAAELVAAERRGRALDAGQQRRYTRRFVRSAAVFRRLIHAFYDDASYAVFLDPTPPWQLGRAVNSVVAGQTRLPWSVRWRYWAFLAVCRLQRRHPVVARVPLKKVATAAAARLAEPPAAGCPVSPAAVRAEAAASRAG